MTDRQALAEALELLYEHNPDEQGRNTTPVRYPLDVIGAAAQERLAQLPEPCRHDKTGEHWVPVGELPPSVNNAVCPGAEYPVERVEPIFGLIYEAFGWEDAPECRDLAVRILALVLNGKYP